MTNFDKLIVTLFKVVRHKMDKEIYEEALRLIYIATQSNHVNTRALREIELVLCEKLGLDDTEVSKKYHNLKTSIPVDDMIFDYGRKNGFEICFSDYNTNIIKFKEEYYHNEYDDNSDYDDYVVEEEYIFDDDDIVF